MNRVEQLLQRALDNWQRWDASLTGLPAVIAELSGGKTNRSFLVSDSSCRAVVRVNAEHSEQLGIIRARELSILSLLGNTGVVPSVLYSDGDVLVTRYVEGRQWAEQDFHNPKKIKQLEQLLALIQKVKTPEAVEPRNYQHYCDDYISQLTDKQRKEHSAQINRWIDLAHQLDQAEWFPVICHHDLVPENIIDTEQGLVILDWEYAAWGHPAIDYLKINPEHFKHPDKERLLTLMEGIDTLWCLLQV